MLGLQDGDRRHQASSVVGSGLVREGGTGGEVAALEGAGLGRGGSWHRGRGWGGAGLAGRAGLVEVDANLAFAWLAPSPLEGALS